MRRMAGLMVCVATVASGHVEANRMTMAELRGSATLPNALQ